jgi:L-fuculose-phosphate aldolase
LPGSAALGQNIAATFSNGCDCVVLENHGVVTGGDSLHVAFERFETLEFTAKTWLKAVQLGAPRMLDEAALALQPCVTKGTPRGTRAAATSLEKELRRQIREFVRRSYQQRLMISTEGALSARLAEDAFLITPHGVDRSRIEIDDLVLVQNGEPEPGRTPSSSTASHRAIYLRQPSLQAIINAYPVNATAFSVTDSKLDSRTIPESYIFLRDVQRSAFGVRMGDGRELAGRLTLENPIMLLDNDGVMVVGTSVLDVFDRLEVLESTAEAMINSRALGPLVPMSDSVIEELKQAFFK